MCEAHTSQQSTESECIKLEPNSTIVYTQQLTHRIISVYVDDDGSNNDGSGDDDDDGGDGVGWTLLSLCVLLLLAAGCCLLFVAANLISLSNRGWWYSIVNVVGFCSFLFVQHHSSTMCVWWLSVGRLFGCCFNVLSLYVHTQCLFPLLLSPTLHPIFSLVFFTLRLLCRYIKL